MVEIPKNEAKCWQFKHYSRKGLKDYSVISVSSSSAKDGQVPGLHWADSQASWPKANPAGLLHPSSKASISGLNRANITLKIDSLFLYLRVNLAASDCPERR